MNFHHHDGSDKFSISECHDAREESDSVPTYDATLAKRQEFQQ